jgi:hypothetical protein
MRLDPESLKKDNARYFYEEELSDDVDFRREGASSEMNEAIPASIYPGA